ncbi:hypothetical protein [Rhizobium sp. ICMP 5592]|uniref:hypothetical protein n=1 Tax=Rhizobium sp. ICMP 5592 TaxID=2292445 RepID=UPI0012977A60|nr:hypothetical protein [Rhizobium sp. ICMP 5592]MQB45196.1 hypothetical protein [Rhizobium sp. ICMP 5592]
MGHHHPAEQPNFIQKKPAQSGLSDSNVHWLGGFFRPPPKVSSSRALRAYWPLPLDTQGFKKRRLLQPLRNLACGDLAKHRVGLLTDLALESLAGFQGWSDMDWHYLHPPFELLAGWARAFTASIMMAPAVIADGSHVSLHAKREEDDFISA